MRKGGVLKAAVAGLVHTALGGGFEDAANVEFIPAGLVGLEIQKQIGEAFQIAPEFPLLLGRIALGNEGQVDLDGRLAAFQNRDDLNS